MEKQEKQRNTTPVQLCPVDTIKSPDGPVEQIEPAVGEFPTAADAEKFLAEQAEKGHVLEGQRFKILRVYSDITIQVQRKITLAPTPTQAPESNVDFVNSLTKVEEAPEGGE